ncbi:MAG: EVE domain-containing protein [Caldilineaceae bacterium]
MSSTRIDRIHLEEAQKSIERLLPPQLENRHMVFRLFVDCIESANRISPRKWGVTLHSHSLLLNFGSIATCILRSDSLWLIIDNDIANQHELEQYKDTGIVTDGYRSLKCIGLRLPFDWIDEELIEDIRASHMAVYTRADQKWGQLHGNLRHAHSPALLEYARQLLGRPDLPYPIHEQTIEEGLESIWLFQANPRYYDLATELQAINVGDSDSWVVTRYREEMQPGDIVLIWQSGRQAGLYAIGQLTDEPEPVEERASEQEIADRPYLAADWRVTFRYTQLLEQPLLRSSLKNHPILGTMQVIQSPQASNFRVSAAEWAAIRSLLSADSLALSFYCKGHNYRFHPGNNCEELIANLISVLQDSGAEEVAQTIGHVARGLIQANCIKTSKGRGKNADVSWLPDNSQLPEFFRFGDRSAFEHVQTYIAELQEKGYTDQVEYVEAFLEVAVTGKCIRGAFASTQQITENILSTRQEFQQESKQPMLDILRNQTSRDGLYFTDWQLATFYTALQAKGFVILSGISGTGKSKLAQHFAGILPRPLGKIDVMEAEEYVAINVKPYMLKYGRMIVPRSAARLFTPPAPGEQVEVRVDYDEYSQNCRFTNAAYTGTSYMQLLLPGKIGQKFKQNVSVGDSLGLEPIVDADTDILTGFRLFNPATESNAEVTEGNCWLFLSVRPDWRDSKSLLGYFNPITQSYEWTEFLRFLLRSEQDYRKNGTEALAWFVILDEMNLAHVEYYFADLLSVMESGRDKEGWSREALRFSHPIQAELDSDLPPVQIHLPPNFYIIGTVNVDETTHAFSPKVLDRAFTLELNEVNFTQYPQPMVTSDFALLTPDQRRSLLVDFTRSGRFVHRDKQKIASFVEIHPYIRMRLHRLNELLRQTNHHFGYRVFDEIVEFLIAADENLTYSAIEDDPFDAAILTKVLPKFHGSRNALQLTLQRLLAWCSSPDEPPVQKITEKLNSSDISQLDNIYHEFSWLLPRTAQRIWRMLYELRVNGFTAF